MNRGRNTTSEGRTLDYLSRFFSLREIRLFLFPVLLFTSCQLFSVSVVGQTFRAAVTKVDITPKASKWLLGYGPRQSTGVHDHIYHRIVLLDDGKTQFVLISTDLCVLSPSECDKVKAQLKLQLGIEPLNVWWTVTHDHSAPEVGPPGLPDVFMPNRYHHPIDSEYTSLIEQRLINGVAEAKRKLTSARLGIGWGFSNANINRRALDVDGKASLGMNPDKAVDHRIGLIRINKEDGSPIALIANYPMHGTVLGGQNLQISGDAPGIVSEYVEQKIGAPVLFINGAAGNIAPIYSVYPTPSAGHLGEFRVLLGDKIVDAYKQILYTTDTIKLVTGSLTVETPRKSGLGWPSYLDNYTRTIGGIHMVRLPIQFLKINDDVAIWSAPVELFCEISNKIREQSPFLYTFYFGYNNGWLGYFPTSESFKEGGYEVNTVCPYTPSAENDLTESVLGYLQGEMRSKQ